jgi:hypothetical protein
MRVSEGERGALVAYALGVLTRIIHELLSVGMLSL